MQSLRFLLKAVMLPPAGPLIIAALGWWLRRRRPRLGDALLATGLGALTILSMPLCGGYLLASLATSPPLRPASLPGGAGAIVILGGDTREAIEFGGLDIGPTTLQRLRYGAWLHRATGLPVLATGGIVGKNAVAVGTLMARSLETEFRVPVRWVESASRNTAENASLSAPLLRAAGIDTILLVSSAFHLPRAIPAFEAAGLRVIPAPVNAGMQGFSPVPGDLVPRASGLLESAIGLHEWLGRAWYALVRWAA